MALSVKLDMRQGQQLVMTPQLQQAIRLLQLSNMELSAYVDAELERNPLLERPNGDSSLSDAPLAPAPEAQLPDLTQALDRAGSTDTAAREIDTDHETMYPDASRADLPGNADRMGQSVDSLSSWASVRQRTSNESSDYNLEEFVASEPSLKDHMVAQMQIALVDPIERLIAHHFIDLLDEAGYISVDMSLLAQKLGTQVELLESVLSRLQAFDPPGIFARSLAECLALQLKDQNRLDPQIALFLEHLPLLAQHNMPALRRAVNCDADELSEMLAEIRKLNPKPGLRFGSEPLQPVVPDVHVRAATDGSWLIELNTETLPRVLVNRGYYAKVSSSSSTDKDKDYLTDCLATANWLVKSLDQRARTILRVSQEIVRQQDGFLTHGVEHLRPLNLRTVADAIKMHESTVSRVTSNKYMATPRGIFELKYFFTSAIASSGEGESHSSEAVRHRIKQLIDGETADAVMSDDKLVDRLKAEGIDIARRTVAKYREAMRISSSVQRRRERKLTPRHVEA